MIFLSNARRDEEVWWCQTTEEQRISAQKEQGLGTYGLPA